MWTQAHVKDHKNDQGGVEKHHCIPNPDGWWWLMTSAIDWIPKWAPNLAKNDSTNETHWPYTFYEKHAYVFEKAMTLHISWLSKHRDPSCFAT